MKRTAMIMSALTVFAMVACQTKVGPAGPAGPQGASGQSGAAATGGTSGGGAWTKASSLPIMRIVQAELISTIRMSAPEIFANLPRGWTREKLIGVIENARASWMRDDPNYGGDRFLSHGVDSSGPYIEVLRPFFMVYGAIPIGERGALQSARDQLFAIQVMFLHEIAHFWVGDEPDELSETVAQNLLSALHRNMIRCEQASPTEGFRYQTFSVSRAFGYGGGRYLHGLKAPAEMPDRTFDLARAAEQGYRVSNVPYPNGANAQNARLENGRLVMDVGCKDDCPSRLTFTFDGPRVRATLSGGPLYRNYGDRQQDPTLAEAEFNCEQIADQVAIPARAF